MAVSLKRWLNDIFLRIKTWILFSLISSMKSPLRWSWIFWDGYDGNDFPDEMMRFVRILVGITGLLRVISPAWVGLFFFVDGIYSIYRHRVEVPRTNHWYEDIPRGARSFFGFFLLFGFV